MISLEKYSNVSKSLWPPPPEILRTREEGTEKPILKQRVPPLRTFGDVKGVYRGLYYGYLFDYEGGGEREAPEIRRVGVLLSLFLSPSASRIEKRGPLSRGCARGRISSYPTRGAHVPFCRLVLPAKRGPPDARSYKTIN